MSNLYPLKFAPRLKEKIWGGDALVRRWGKQNEEDKKIGESWEISGLQGDLSVVSNGFLEGNNIEELIEVYMGDLVGEEVFEKFGNEFPLLIKLIDTREPLSIQVHPDDALALKRHSSYGKTEMWYILDSGNDSVIYSGFRNDVKREEFINSLQSENLPALLNKIKPLPGDSFFVPSGTIHAIGKDLVLVEIQQTSDITYRVFDWGRADSNGITRELHTDLALDAIEYSKTTEPKNNHVNSMLDRPVKLAACHYFNVNIIKTEGQTTRDYTLTDSFIIYVCTNGNLEVEAEGCSVKVEKGETVLIPAIADFVNIGAAAGSEFLEIFLDSTTINNNAL